MAYKYNPLLKLDLQKQQDVPEPPEPTYDDALSDTSENAVQNKVITAKITRMESDTRKKVSKFFASIEELEVGEIGQYQGETTEEFTHGFFYERQPGSPAQYEDVTIPSGSKKLIYTNKFDQTQKIVYSIATETLSDSVVTQYDQKGFAWLLDDTVHYNIIHISNSDWLYNSTSLIPETTGLLYSLDDTLLSIYNSYADRSISSVRSLFQFINGVLLNSGFRLSTSSAGIYGQITDLVFHINIPLIYTDHGGGVPTTSTNTRLMLAGDLAAYNYDIDAYISQIYETGVDDQWCYDPSRDCTFSCWDIVISVGDLKYILHNSGGSGQYTSQMYRTVSDDGQYERYVDIHHLLCVFDSQPISTSSYWAQNIDIGLYFDYTATIEDTTEAITIRRKIQQYDEYGFPIADVPTYVRRDTQPALNPTDFATSAQGAKADSALQSISKGTDGNFITTTIGAKAGNSQTVSSSLTIQALSNAGASAKGLAEASDVKEYIGNNTATRAQGTKADSALQGIDHGTDGQFITTTVTQKANNSQTIYSALTLQDIATADAQHQGVAEASDVKKYFTTYIPYNPIYGIMWDRENPDPDCVRIGNLDLHATLPVHSQIVGGTLTDAGAFSPFADQSDWTGETRDGSVGQVMSRLPKFYYKFITEGTKCKVLFSADEASGFQVFPMQYISSYKATLQRSTSKLSSVVNLDADYRGGNNNADWDGTYRTLLGKPASNISLTNFRTYARNRNDGDTQWNAMVYMQRKMLYWLFAVEYATRNTQKAYNAALDSNGCRQGGLGVGVTDWDWDSWNAFNAHYPLIPCGYTDEYGNATAQKQYDLIAADGVSIAHTFQVPRYRGIESPFGDIWEWHDGILVSVQADDAGGKSPVYVTADPSKFSSTDFTQYDYVCDGIRSENYIKDIHFGDNGDIICTSTPGASTQYYCDWWYGANLPSSGTSLRGVHFGGRAAGGAHAGLVFGHSYLAPADVSAYIGSRLCYIPELTQPTDGAIATVPDHGAAQNIRLAA